MPNSTTAMRKEARDEIERLIAFLDRAAGDPDLEDGGDDELGQDGELSLGWTGTINQTGQRFGLNGIRTQPTNPPAGRPESWRPLRAS